MQKVLFTLALAIGLAAAAPAVAGKDKKEPAAKPAAGAEVTLSGTMMCGKCYLKETDGCQNVLQVKDGGKDVKYYLAANDVAKENHSKVCGGTAKAQVTGTVGEAGGKKTLTASKIKYE